MACAPWHNPRRQSYEAADTYGDFRPPTPKQIDERTRNWIALSTIVALAFLLYWSQVTMSSHQPDQYYGKILTPSNYSVVQGIFAHSEPEFKDDEYDLLKDSFGLIDKSPERWIKFERYITELNKAARDTVTYKVIYLARHGQGVHNLAEDKYGTPFWNCKWSLLESDGDLVWGPDPLLTTEGQQQVRRTRDAWVKQLEDRVPLPQVIYSSPLRRAIDTAELTWNGASLAKGISRKVKENMREMIGLHTCDKRSTRSLLETAYPAYQFDPDFTEADQLWTPHYQEQPPQIALRARLALNNLFATDSNTFISITAHGGFIGGLLRAIGHRHVALQTAGMIPIVIRATSDPTEGMEPIEGGQSGTAPPCVPSATASATSSTDGEVAKETRGVESRGDLVIQSP